MSDTSTTTEPWNVDRLLKWTRSHFQSKGLDEPRLKAELLLAHALGWRKIDLYARFDHIPAEQPLGKYRELVKSAARAEPIAYLIGRKEFYSFEFEVTPDVLIPRPETELVVEEAISWVKSHALSNPSICDVGTGSGCIAVTLAKRLTGATVAATDISPAALAVAKRNADKHGVGSSISFIEADLLNLATDVVPAGGFDLIVSNPPYVAKGSPETLAEDVRKYEPAAALYGGMDGLEYYRRIAAEIRFTLREKGGLIVEIGSGQADVVKTILTTNTGLSHRTTRRDAAGIERVLVFGPAS